MEPDLVSIVVVAYNNWPDLELAIQSALCQSYRPIEVIVVDNASSDATAVEVRNLFGARVRYVRQANTGDAGAYNTGIGETRGRFVQLLDGDDVLAPYKIEKEMEIFHAEPEADVVYGDSRLFQAQEGEMEVEDTSTGPEKDLLATILASGGDYLGNTLGPLWRRTVFDVVGLWDEKVYVTDVDYYLRALTAGCQFRPCPDSLMGFVAVGPDKMSSNIARMLAGHEALWTKALGYITQEPYCRLVRRNLARVQFFRAVRRDGLGVREALSKLRQARAACAMTVPLSAFLAGAAVAVVPGGRTLVTLPLFRTIRRNMGRWIGYPL